MGPATTAPRQRSLTRGVQEGMHLMKCLNCQSENSDASKFCSSCGARLGVRCPKCNQSNDPGSKYCSACGTLVSTVETEESRPAVRTSAAEPSGERRQATVVFSDLAGYTSLAEQVDPEEVNELLGLLRHA